MVRRSLVTAFAAVALSIVLWGCSGAATPQPVASSPTSAASGAASAVVPSEAAPSAAEPSVAASDAAAASVGAEPGFSLPSDDKGLEALLPDTICGVKTTKASVSGARFAESGQSEFLDALKAVGKTANDVTFAIAAGPDSNCTAGILRIKDVDPTLLKNAMLAASAKSGETATQKNVGGKDVYVTVGPDSTSYVYFHGDAVIFVSAKNDSDAGTILQSLP
jgi:hypothetical protein